MKNRFGFLLLIMPFFLVACSPEKPNILIIGDSISGGYTPFVQEYLKDKATVVRISENGKHAGYGITRIREYIGDEKWDIIHFNYGLHDLCYRHPDSKLYGGRDKINGKLPYGIDKYEEHLDSIVKIMKELSGAKLIFLTTTYVPENEGGRFADDARIYNEIAKKVMKKHQVIINDIYDQSIEIHKKHGIGDDDVHYTAAGSEMLAKIISEFLEGELAD